MLVRKKKNNDFIEHPAFMRGVLSDGTIREYVFKT